MGYVGKSVILYLKLWMELEGIFLGMRFEKFEFNFFLDDNIYVCSIDKIICDYFKDC